MRSSCISVRSSGAGIGQTRGFDHHAFELAAAGARKAPVRIAQGLGKVAAQGTADAAAGQFDHGLLCRVAHQQMVERRVTVLVDDDQRIGHVRLRQKAIEQRGLAAAQETGQQHHRNMRRVIDARPPAGPDACADCRAAAATSRAHGRAARRPRQATEKRAHRSSPVCRTTRRPSATSWRTRGSGRKPQPRPRSCASIFMSSVGTVSTSWPGSRLRDDADKRMALSAMATARCGRSACESSGPSPCASG
jgi:hypothetical protein